MLLTLCAAKIGGIGEVPFRKAQSNKEMVGRGGGGTLVRTRNYKCVVVIISLHAETQENWRCGSRPWWALGTSSLYLMGKPASRVRRTLKSQLEKLGRGHEFTLPLTFVLLRPSEDWMRPTCIGRATCCPWSTNSNTNDTGNTLTDTQNHT